jgi:hypothetical protein
MRTEGVAQNVHASLTQSRHALRATNGLDDAISRDRRSMRGPWATACKRAKLGDRRFNDLRRSGVRNFIRAGIPERVVMRMGSRQFRRKAEET